MRKKYVKEYLELSRLLVSDFLLFIDLFWSSWGPRFWSLESRVLGSQGLKWVLGYGSWVPGSQVLNPGSWVLILDYIEK